MARKGLHSEYCKARMGDLLDVMKTSSEKGDTVRWCAVLNARCSMEGAYQTALLREMLEKRDGLMSPVREEGRKFRIDSEEKP